MIEEWALSLGAFFARGPLSVLADVIDIAVVATLIYFGLSLIRGTRAMQMSVGLALVFVVYQLAHAGGLMTIWTILDVVLEASVLVIVIIFQNDLRRALMRLGRRPFLRGKKHRRETHEIEEVIKATRALAQRRIGALIVFQREATLDEFIEKGTELDAVVSKELLYSIFIPSYENPMHDGAAIIRDGRVTQAGSFLPLSIRAKVDQKLGARHRAAIGISEETDAVVVIVSEERGSVSLCFGGNVVQALDGPALREALHGLFYHEEQAKDAPSEVIEAIVAPEPPPKTEPPLRTSIPASSSGILESPAEGEGDAADTVEDASPRQSDASEPAPSDATAPAPAAEGHPPVVDAPQETAAESKPPDTEAVVDGIQVKATKRVPVPDPDVGSEAPEAEAKDEGEGAGSNVTPIASKWEDKAG